jgi:hypothetical protein
MVLKRFSAAYGKSTKYRDVPSSSLKEHSELPTELLENWKENGLSMYRDGLLWFTNPDDFNDGVRALFGESSAKCVARTAFGDLILFGKPDRWLHFSADTLDSTDYTADYFTFFDFAMTDQGWMKNVMRVPLFEKALAKLGPLDERQVYAFQPHPALGGSGELDTIEKSRLFEYLDLLSQLRK